MLERDAVPSIHGHDYAFYAPASKDGGPYYFTSVCLSIHLSIQHFQHKNYPKIVLLQVHGVLHGVFENDALEYRGQRAFCMNENQLTQDLHHDPQSTSTALTLYLTRQFWALPIQHQIEI